MIGYEIFKPFSVSLFSDSYFYPTNAENPLPTIVNSIIFDQINVVDAHSLLDEFNAGLKIIY